jgi:hypothetical protein
VQRTWTCTCTLASQVRKELSLSCQRVRDSQCFSWALSLKTCFVQCGTSNCIYLLIYFWWYWGHSAIWALAQHICYFLLSLFPDKKVGFMKTGNSMFCSLWNAYYIGQLCLAHGRY